MARRASDFLQTAVEFGLLDLQDLSHVSATCAEMSVHVLESTSLKNILQRKVEEEGNLDTENRMVDVGFQEMAALKHSLKVALHIYEALQHSRCFACRGLVTNEDRRSIGLSYFKYALCTRCFHALTTLCTEDDDSLAENHCIALTAEGVHAAVTLLNAYRAGSECRMSQSDAAWVRNVIADSEIFLPDLLRELSPG